MDMQPQNAFVSGWPKKADRTQALLHAYHASRLWWVVPTQETTAKSGLSGPPTAT